MRWAAFALLVAAVGVVTIGVMLPWIGVAAADAPLGDRHVAVDMGLTTQFPGVVWLFDGIGVLGLAFVLVTNRPYRTSATVIAVASVVGAAAMGWTALQLRGAEARIGVMAVPTHLMPGVWLTLAGFVAAAAAAAWLRATTRPAAAG